MGAQTVGFWESHMGEIVSWDCSLNHYGQTWAQAFNDHRTKQIATGKPPQLPWTVGTLGINIGGSTNWAIQINRTILRIDTSNQTSSDLPTFLSTVGWGLWMGINSVLADDVTPQENYNPATDTSDVYAAIVTGLSSNLSDPADFLKCYTNGIAVPSNRIGKITSRTSHYNTPLSIPLSNDVAVASAAETPNIAPWFTSSPTFDIVLTSKWDFFGGPPQPVSRQSVFSAFTNSGCGILDVGFYAP
jgi:hypothetical protein